MGPPYLTTHLSYQNHREHARRVSQFVKHVWTSIHLFCGRSKNMLRPVTTSPAPARFACRSTPLHPQGPRALARSTSAPGRTPRRGAGIHGHYSQRHKSTLPSPRGGGSNCPPPRNPAGVMPGGVCFAGSATSCRVAGYTFGYTTAVYPAMRFVYWVRIWVHRVHEKAALLKISLP